MSTDHKYNGWRNYETWAAKLWLDNEEPSYRAVRALVADAWEEAADEEPERRAEAAAYRVAEVLKQEHEEGAPELGASIYSDLLSAAQGEIDWDEIGRAYVDDGVAEGELEQEEADEEEAALR